MLTYALAIGPEVWKIAAGEAATKGNYLK